MSNHPVLFVEQICVGIQKDTIIGTWTILRDLTNEQTQVSELLQPGLNHYISPSI